VSLIGGCAVSFADMLEGFFGQISRTREPPRTRSPDTPAPRLSFDLLLGSPRRLPGLGTRLGRSLQTSVRSVSRTNERTLFLACVLGPNLPSAVFLSRAFLQTAQDLEEVTSHRSEFSLASFRLESPPPCYRSWRCFEADRDLHDT
jgi:hypothetical protein